MLSNALAARPGAPGARLSSRRVRSREQRIRAETRWLIPRAHFFTAHLAYLLYGIWKRRPRFDHFVQRAAVANISLLEPVAEQVRDPLKQTLFGMVDAPTHGHARETVIFTLHLLAVLWEGALSLTHGDTRPVIVRSNHAAGARQPSRPGYLL
jgi:hypothetical protein